MIIIDEIDQPNLFPHFNEITAMLTNQYDQ